MFKGLLYDSLIVQKGGGEFSSEGGVREQPKQQEIVSKRKLLSNFLQNVLLPKAKFLKHQKKSVEIQKW